MWRLCLVEEKVDPPKGVENPTGPTRRLAFGKRRWTLATQCSRHRTSKFPILLGKMPVAELVSKRYDSGVGRSKVRWNFVSVIWHRWIFLYSSRAAVQHELYRPLYNPLIQKMLSV